MKGIRHILSIACLALLALSCHDTVNIGDDKPEISSVSFSATIDKENSTKTTLSLVGTSPNIHGKLTWNENNESITVNGTSLSMDNLSSDGVANFKGEVSVSNYYVAAYCPGSNLQWDSEDGTMSFNFPTNQTYNMTSQLLNSIPMVAVTSKDGIVSGKVPLAFKNACTVLSFNLKGKDFSVSKIELSTNDKSLVGTINVDVGDGRFVYFTPSTSSEAESKITLTCSPAVALNETSETNFMVMTPNLVSGTELEIKIYNSDNTVCKSGRLTVKSGGFSLSTLQNIPISFLEPTEGELPGVFSIGDGKYIKFSKGNLQYLAKSMTENGTTYPDNTFRFAEEQWYHYGATPGGQPNGGNLTDSADRETQTKWIDMFSYGTSGYNSLYPYKNDPSSGFPNTNISETEYDWGVHNSIFNGGNKKGVWRTLTKAEWDNLLANNYYTLGTIQYDANGTNKEVNGVILLPPNFVDPLKNKKDKYNGTLYGGPGVFISVSSYAQNVYDTDGWAMMEQSGAVFLPNAGALNNQSGTLSDNTGHYWTSTAHYAVYIHTTDALKRWMGYGTYNYWGFAVRLVKNATQETQTEVYIDEYGIDRGAGKVINGVTWAPVNCGYLESGTLTINGNTRGYPYGKLYQWGRKDGFGRGGSVDATMPNISADIYLGALGQEDSLTLYRGVQNITETRNGWNVSEVTNNWVNTNGMLWSSTIKTILDPCPSGWRVPSKEDFVKLSNTSYVTITPGAEYTTFQDKNQTSNIITLNSGYWNNGEYRGGLKKYTYYWTGLPRLVQDPQTYVSGDPSAAYAYGFGETNTFQSQTGNERRNALFVRCVKQ